MNDQALLDVALAAADAADEILRHYFKVRPDAMTKSDGTPVTIADQEAEAAIAETISSAFPSHGFYGEESGSRDMDREVVWLVDPLDGTKSFVRQTPFFSTQIACVVNQELRVGVSSAPLFGERGYATASGDCVLNDERCAVSDVDDLAAAAISLGNIQSLAGDAQRWTNLGGILARVNRIRGYGDFCHYHYLARGAVDAVIESDVNILDIAALTVMVRSAGGILTDLEGRAPNLDTRSVVAANPSLHARLLEAINA